MRRPGLRAAFYIPRLWAVHAACAMTLSVVVVLPVFADTLPGPTVAREDTMRTEVSEVLVRAPYCLRRSCKSRTRLVPSLGSLRASKKQQKNGAGARSSLRRCCGEAMQSAGLP